MIQDDYVMRMIRQATMLMGKLLQFKNVGDTNTVLEIIEKAYDELLRIDPELIDNISPEGLLSMLQEKKDWQLVHYSLLANLLYEKALIDQSDGHANEALQKFKKALLLFTFVNEQDTVYDMSRTAKIEALERRISE